MPPPPPPPPRPPWLDWTLLGALALGVLAPGLGTLARLDATESATEKRRLATWPARSQPLVSWRDGVQAFLADRFGGREALLRLHGTSALALGDSPSPRIVLGRDGWLFCGDDERGGLLGDRPLDPERLAAWVAALDGRRRWAHALGARYVLLVAPDKHTIYPEHVPPGLVPPGPTPLDVFLEHLAAERPELLVLDLRAALRAAKPRGPLYWRLDSHWTPDGALCGAQAVFACAREQGLDVAPLPRSAAPRGPWEPVSDLALLTGVPERFSQPAVAGPRADAAPAEARPGVELCADSFGHALRPWLELRFRCSEPLGLETALDPETPLPALVLDVMVERKLALDAPMLPQRADDLVRASTPALRFKASRESLFRLEAAALAALQADPPRAATAAPEGLRLAGASAVTLRPPAAPPGAGWAQVELELRQGAHRVLLREPGGVRATVLPPGRHRLTWARADPLELTVEASGGGALDATLLRWELRADAAAE